MIRLEHTDQRWTETLRALINYDIAGKKLHYQNETRTIETGVTYYQLLSSHRGSLLNFYIADNGKRVNL